MSGWRKLEKRAFLRKLQFPIMPTYIYETIPQNEVEQPKRFEVRQSMADKAFTHHPDTGVPVRRVIAGGTGMMGSKSSASSGPSGGGGGGCGSGCGCH